MLRTFIRRAKCLVGLVFCLAAVQLQLRGGCHSYPVHVKHAAGIQKRDIGMLGLHPTRWLHSFKASASLLPFVSYNPQPSSPLASPIQIISAPAPAPSIFSAVAAPEPSAEPTSNNSLIPSSSSQSPVIFEVSSPSPMVHIPAPPPVETPIAAAQPPLPSSSSSNSPSPSRASSMHTPPSPPSGSAFSSSIPALPSSASAPTASPTSTTPLNTSGIVPVSPLLPPSTGCCAENMVLKPGSLASSCVCVYPIQIELLIEGVLTTMTNWSGVFQDDLSSQLGVTATQIEIISFKFIASNLSLVIAIAPLESVSFSSEDAKLIKTKLDQYRVHFNSSFFGNYTLRQFQYFQAPVPAPVQMPYVGMPPLPSAQILNHDGTIRGKGGHGLLLWHIIVITAAAVVITVFAVLITLWRRHRNSRRKQIACGSNGRSLLRQLDVRSCASASIPRSITTRLFTFDELNEATSNFNPENVLGEGGFGRVYKGVLNDGTAVAIKRFGGGGQFDQEFVVEVEMLSRLHHRNLVKLVGYYASQDSSQHLLCYELIPNGSLEAWLHGPLGACQPLDWDTRMQIALDAARGLAYLHEDSQPCVIHRDFKASNILIEDDFHAKVADFGLAKQAPEGEVNYVATQVMGTFGYVAPEYAMTGHLLVKSDVYSYGVVLLELLSGRKPVDMSQPSGQENLVTLARPLLRNRERLGELADPKLSNKYPKEDFIHVATIAAACVASEASQRPTMGEVVQSLRMIQRQYTTSGERTISANDALPPVVPSRSFIPTMHSTHHHASGAFESDGSSSIFSSGPFSGVVPPLDNDPFSRSAVFSEDLHEGR